MYLFSVTSRPTDPILRKGQPEKQNIKLKSLLWYTKYHSVIQVLVGTVVVEIASHRLALLVGGVSLRDRGPSGPTGTKSKQAVDQETSQELTKNNYYLLRVAIRTNVFELVINYL